LRSGHLFILLTVNIVATVIINDIFLSVSPLAMAAVGPIAGLAAEALFWLLKPSLANLRQLRFFAGAVPTALYATYFAIIIFNAGLWWSIHFWIGAICLAGAMGWLVSYLVIPSGYEKISVIPS
jgi:hypothetical protein